MSLIQNRSILYPKILLM